MAPLLKNLKALWLAAAHGEFADVRFSRGLTIRSRKVRRKSRPTLWLVNTTGAPN